MVYKTSSRGIDSSIPPVSSGSAEAMADDGRRWPTMAYDERGWPVRKGARAWGRQGGHVQAIRIWWTHGFATDWTVTGRASFPTAARWMWTREACDSGFPMARILAAILTRRLTTTALSRRRIFAGGRRCWWRYAHAPRIGRIQRARSRLTGWRISSGCEVRRASASGII